MNDELMDRILMFFGEIIGKRQFREESCSNVQVSFFVKDDYCAYHLIWYTGDKLEVVYSSKSEDIVLAILPVKSYAGGLNRSLATVVHTIIEENHIHMRSKKGVAY